MYPEEIDLLIKKIESGEATDEDELTLLREIDNAYSILNTYLDEERINQLKEQLEHK